MKQTIFTTIACLAAFGLAAQNTFPSSGNVGVGTTSPATKLQVASSNNPTISIGQLNTNTNGKSSLVFYAGTASKANGFSVRYFKDDETDRLGFIDGGGIEGVSVLNGGKVGIGTSNLLTANTLEVYSGSNTEYISAFRSDEGVIFFGGAGPSTENPTYGNYVCSRLGDNTGYRDFGIKTASGIPQLIVTTTGDVGIGKLIPEGRLHIKDNQLDIFTSKGRSNGWTKDGLTITANPDVNYSTLRVNSYHAPVSDRGVLNVTRSSNSLFYVRTDGNVGVGTTNPSQKLEVNGTIYSREVKVDVQAGTGPDYVFEEDYNLPSLEEIEAFIHSEKHLPEVPSAAAMEANGVQLGEMNMLLLRKIEELTLYTIEQQKLIEQQNELNAALIKRIEKLESKN